MANLELPTPKSGKFVFRLARMPRKGLPTVIDLQDYKFRLFLRVTRVLKSLEEVISDEEEKNQPVPVEISSRYLDRNEFLTREFRFINNDNFFSNLENCRNSSHFFLFYSDSLTYTAAGISNPHHNPKAEMWQRLINRTYGLEHHAPRRHLRSCNLLSA